MTVDGREFALKGRGLRRKYAVAIVRPGGRYKISAEHVPLVAAIVNPLHPRFAAFRALEQSKPSSAPRRSFASLNRSLGVAFDGKLSVAQAHKLFEKIIRIALRYVPASSPIDARVTKALRLLNASGNKSMAKLSKAVGLSYFRLSHLFTNSIGISLRNYLLWQKIHKIPALYSGGATLTQIAKKTGFTDAPHFARTFREVFGAPPSFFLGGDSVRIVSWTDVRGKRFRGHRRSTKRSAAAETMR
ncbi:MAG TPA: AraC family transcriptional regulator [Steroidobacteraceae bacterium]|nr:AraC family transcriptional regulator [Steroidobacteraceae bacterium]